MEDWNKKVEQLELLRQRVLDISRMRYTIRRAKYDLNSIIKGVQESAEGVRMGTFVIEGILRGFEDSLEDISLVEFEVLKKYESEFNRFFLLLIKFLEIGGSFWVINSLGMQEVKKEGENYRIGKRVYKNFNDYWGWILENIADIEWYRREDE